jgi:hypothetical protein
MLAKFNFDYAEQTRSELAMNEISPNSSPMQNDITVKLNNQRMMLC